MLEELIEIGLNKTEAEIYLILLENNRLTPARISMITGINRSTVYAAAEELLKKGVIAEDLSGKTKYFVALRPENFLDSIDRQSREIKKKEIRAKEIIRNLELLPKSKNYSIPKIQFVEGTDIKDFIQKKTPIWEQSMKDTGEKTWWGFQDHSYVENKTYRDLILWYWERASKDIDLKLFTNESGIEEKMKKENLERRQLKFWRGKEFTSTQWILGEYIISIVTREKLHYLVQIRDAVLADNMRNFVKYAWENDL